MARTVYRNNADQIQRIRQRFNAYRKLGFDALFKGVPFKSMILTKFPFLFKDQPKPSHLGLETTDACNLKCDYCNNPLFATPRQFMKRDVMERVLEEQKKVQVPRVMVGGGEPTLHPQFEAFSRELKQVTPYQEIVTNVHWRKPETVDALVDNYDLIEISMDAGGKEHFERSRKNGDHDRVVHNIEELARAMKKRNKKGLLCMRLMIRPSVAHLKNSEAAFWSRYCDVIKPQFVQKHTDVPNEEDVYFPVQFPEGSFPKCTLPFKSLQVKPNGDIPMCAVTGNALDPKRKLTIDNILEQNILDVWNGPTMKEVREGHRQRDPDKMSICRGCGGR